MKKSILATSLLLALSACSSDNDESDDQQPSNTAATIAGELTFSANVDSTQAQGTVTVSDPDEGEESIVAQNNAAASFGVFSISADGQYTYVIDSDNATLIALPDGATISETLAIASADGTTSSIIATLIGVNEDAEFTSGSGVDAITIENDESAAVNGSIVVTDPDTGESSFVEQSNQQSSFGSFSIDSSGAWTYTLDTSNSTVSALADENDSIVDEITVSSSDGTATTLA